METEKRDVFNVLQVENKDKKNLSVDIILETLL